MRSKSASHILSPCAGSESGSQGNGGQGLNSRRKSSSHSQHLPSPTGGAVTVFSRFCAPPPHRWEQGPHMDHSDSTQSTSQASMLNSCVSVVVPHGDPPFAGTATPRSRDWVPPPQEREQVAHSAHGCMTQSTGHGCRLHSSSRSSTGHSCPDGPAGAIICRVRVRVPPPHSALHGPAAHELTSQSLTSPSLRARVRPSLSNLYCMSANTSSQEV